MNLLKAWKVTVVVIECDNAAFNVILRWSTPETVLSKKKSTHMIVSHKLRKPSFSMYGFGECACSFGEFL